MYMEASCCTAAKPLEPGRRLQPRRVRGYPWLKDMNMASEPKAESKRSIALVQNAQAAAAQSGAQAAAEGAAQAKKMMEDGAAQAKTMMEDGAVQARTTMEKSMEQATKTAEGFFKAAEEAAEFGRGNIEAFTKATQALTVGMQDLGKQYFAVSQALTDHALESAKAFAAVKSLKEAADIQASFAKASMERTMSEATKLQEAAYRLAEQAAAPITARMTLAAENFAKPLAA